MASAPQGGRQMHGFQEAAPLSGQEALRCFMGPECWPDI